MVGGGRGGIGGILQDQGTLGGEDKGPCRVMDLSVQREPQPFAAGGKDGMVGVDGRQDSFFGFEMVLGNLVAVAR